MSLARVKNIALVKNHSAFTPIQKGLILVQGLDSSQNVLVIFKCKTAPNTRTVGSGHFVLDTRPHCSRTKSIFL